MGALKRAVFIFHCSSRISGEFYIFFVPVETNTRNTEMWILGTMKG